MKFYNIIKTFQFNHGKDFKTYSPGRQCPENHMEYLNIDRLVKEWYIKEYVEEPRPAYKIGDKVVFNDGSIQVITRITKDERCNYFYNGYMDDELRYASFEEVARYFQ